MIGFGELRSKSVEWKTELSTVEKFYARDWLIKGVFDRLALAGTLVLRADSALASAYFAKYPRVADVELGRDGALADEKFEQELVSAVTGAANGSGLQYKLASFKPTEMRVEFTGPLGRRSATQPLLVVRFAPISLRLPAAEMPLIHPFRGDCPALIRAVALTELTAERITAFPQKPRSRDVFDLWFILTQGEGKLDLQAAMGLAHTIAESKGVTLRPTLDPSYAPYLERAWTNALKNIPNPPPFGQAIADIQAALASL